MDFHSLTRKELQALCKKNAIPANLTNVAMADALTALNPNVNGMEEISGVSKSVSVQSSVESPERTEVTSPRVPRTRTTRKKVESTTVVNKTTTTTARRLTRNKKDGVAPINIDVQFSEVDNQSEIGKGKEASIPQTPSMVSDTRKRSSKAEITTTKAYSTRRSTRLAAKTLGHTDSSVENKEKPDSANMKLFSADCGDNFEMNDNESCADLTEDVQSTVSHLKEDASETSKSEEILSKYTGVDTPNDLGAESPKESNKSAEKVKTDEENAILGNIWNKETKGDDINKEAYIENKDEIIGENGNDTNEQAVVEMKDVVTGNDGEFYKGGDKLNDNEEIMIGGVEVFGVDINPNVANDDGNLVSKLMYMSLTSMDGVMTQIEDHAASDAVVDEFVPMSEEEPVEKIECELLPKSEVEDLVSSGMLAETEKQAVSDAAVDLVDKIDCDEQSQDYSKEDKLLPKSGVEDLVNGGVQTENHDVSDAIVVDEIVPMSEEEDRLLVKDAALEQVDKIDCDEPSQEYSKEDLVNVAAGIQLVNSEVEFVFDSMSSDEEEKGDIVNVAVGKQLVNGESGKPRQENSKDESEEGSANESEEGSEDESEEGSEDETEEESEDESEEESEDESEEEVLNRDSDKPSELISKEDLPKSFLMEEDKEEEGSEDELEEVEDLVKAAAGAQLNKKPSENSEVDSNSDAMTASPTPGKKNPNESEDELEEVEDLVKVAGGAQLDKKPSENSEKDASSKASILVDESEGILSLPARTVVPTQGKKNPNAVVTGKENTDQMSMRQIRKMIKNLNINADSKNDKKDNLVKKSDEELVETASKRTALQMVPENQP